MHNNRNAKLAYSLNAVLHFIKRNRIAKQFYWVWINEVSNLKLAEIKVKRQRWKIEYKSNEHFTHMAHRWRTSTASADLPLQSSGDGECRPESQLDNGSKTLCAADLWQNGTTTE